MISDNFANSLVISNDDDELRKTLLDEYEPFVKAFLTINTHSITLFSDGSGAVANDVTCELHVFDSASDLLKYCLVKIPTFKEYVNACTRSGVEQSA